MRFTCEKNMLVTGLNIAGRTVAQKSSLSVIEGILCKAGQGLSLTGYNMETAITYEIDADVSDMGQCILPAKLFGDIIRRLPEGSVTVVVDENYKVSIRAGYASFTISAEAAEDYPELPDVDGEAAVRMSQQDLKKLINGTIFAVSDNESRPIHTGSLFEIDDTGLTVVSVDGYRLALRHEPITERDGALSFSFVVPGSALSEVEKICGDGEEEATVTQGERHVMFRVGDTMLVSRRLEGEFLAYRQAIPRNNGIKVEGDTRALLTSIDRVSLIISDKLKSPLRCVFDDNVLKITTKTGIGDASDQCPISGDGGGLEIGFNNRYLMDALKAAPADRVRLELSSGVAPCVILPAEGEENFLYMVLPVRLKAGE